MTVNAATEVHPALALIARRLAAGGGPGARGDGHRLALAIEGGGMRGTITAGMALGVHELGLTPIFDDVYGSSAGAITGALHPYLNSAANLRRALRASCALKVFGDLTDGSQLVRTGGG